MSEEGEKTCPLCAEEMDLTDQQLKPCKCGYEICVWCWHHIMDMAEKDESEGRCPACRTPYDKEKIVRATSSCDRHVLEMNMEKKPKSSRGKNKSSEGRKQLANVRVIQKNLVYVVGLSLNMADEDLLQSREYFGQYGQVLTVSISRTASGALQQFANSTCSIYITYSKEEEAVRCIQSVHGFFLDGKPLKACFGTTKYCHAWLRNSPCSNPDCLYLHEIGSQEDSFTKDEIISAYKRVQQITGSTNSTQRRSGYVLPPPLDENYNNTSSGNTINKTSVNTNNTQIIARVSHPNSSAGRSAALPSGASRGTRVANNLPSHSSIQCSNWALKKPDVSDGLVTSSTAAVNQMRLSSLKSDTANILVTDKDSIVSQDKSETEASSSVVKELNTDEKATPLRIPNTPVHPTTLCVNKQSLGSSPTKLPAMSSSDVSSSLVSDGLSLGIDATDPSNGKMERMTHSHFIANSNQETQMLEGYVHRIGGTVTSQTSETTSTTSEDLDSRDAQSDSRFRMPRSRTPSPATQFDLCDVEDDLLSFENQRLKDPEVAPTGNNSSHDSHLSSHSDVNSTQHSKVDASKDYNIGESSIISNILSIDFDPWDESLTAPQNLAKLLGENDKQLRSFGVPGSWKTLNSNQSRFSFAREESKDEASGFVQSVDYFTKGSNQCSSGHEFFDGIFQLEKLDSRNGFPIFNGMESKPFTGNPSHTYSNRLSVLRPQVSSPPGFSVPNKTPPPGFTYHDRTNQIFDGTGNHLLDANMLRHQSPSADSTIINGEIEFIDPAILAVGKGLRLNNSRIYYSSHSNAHEEAKSQSILQRSLPSHRNQNVTNLGDSSSPLDNDTYSRVMEWNAAYHIPSSDGLIYNGQGDVWNERQAGNNLDMAEILRNERLWLYEYNGGYEDSKIRMPSSDNVFNGAMRILR